MEQIDLGICTCRVSKDIPLSLSNDISKLEINQCFNPFTLFWWVCFSVVFFGFFFPEDLFQCNGYSFSTT